MNSALWSQKTILFLIAVLSLLSGDQNQIQIAVQLQTSQFDKLFKLEALTTQKQIDELTQSIRKIDDKIFRTSALHLLGKILTPDLAIFNHYYHH